MIKYICHNCNDHECETSVCPICGNVIHSVGECMISCHGTTLSPCIVKEIDDYHQLSVSKIEDEYFVDIVHDMNKEHYISFVCGIYLDTVCFVKWNVEM